MWFTSQFNRTIIGALIGFLYGCALAYLSLGAAAGGQGSLVPLAASSAPVSALGPMHVYYALPFMWAVFGVLAALSDSRRSRRLAQALLLLHYGSGLLLLAPYIDPQPFMRLYAGKEAYLAGWIVLYFVGQVLMWEYMRPQQPLQ
jgi:hypothetical protein